MSIYQQLKDAGVPLDSHESDLYAKATPDSVPIILEHEGDVHTFISTADGELWYDIPFAYLPFWESKP